MALHEILGPVLGSVAVILTIYVLKRTLDYQAYREIDSNYMEVLKIGRENPYMRDERWTKDYKKRPEYKTSAKQREKEEQKVLKYEQYALMVWNIIETIYDRNKVDKTWRPIIQAEKNLKPWLDSNTNFFKKEFVDFVSGFEYHIQQEPGRQEVVKFFIREWLPKKIYLKQHKDPKLNQYDAKSKNADLYLENKKKSAIPLMKIGGISALAVVIIILAYQFFPYFFGQVENFESHVALDCAHNPVQFKLGNRPYDCSKFTPGSIAELCVNDLNSFNAKEKSDCSKFIQAAS
jgi:hypothetical protein